jgi:DNA-binding response OmpR family regulator
MACYYCEKCGAPIDHQRQVLEVNGVSLSMDDFTIRHGSTFEKLGKMRAEILALLMKRERVSSDVILSILMPEAESNALNVHIFYLRKHLRRGFPLKIVTLRDFGFQLLPTS